MHLRPVVWPQRPLSWSVSSTICAQPVAPIGWPRESRPPLGLTGSRPPSAVSPSRIIARPAPGSAMPSSSRTMSSAGAAASWTSTHVDTRPVGSRLPGRPPWPLGRPRPSPPRPPDRRADASTRTGSAERRCRPVEDATMTAAAPSPIGEHISNVSGSTIGRLARTSSTVSGSRYCALGLSAPHSWDFTDTRAKSSTVAPERSMYARASSAYTPMNADCFADGSGRPWRSTSHPVSKTANVRPLSSLVSFSAPIASATSAVPEATAAHAS